MDQSLRRGPKRECPVPLKVGDVLKHYLKESGLGRMMAEQDILLNWQGLVGDTVAGHASPETLVKGLLTLKVDNAVWRTELYGMKEHIMDKINAAAGKRLVRDIKFH